MSVATAAALPEGAPGIPFARLLKVEWNKLSDTRSGRWVLGLALLVGGLAIVLAVLLPGSFHQTSEEYSQFAGFVVALLLPVVAILHLTSEFNQRSVLCTFTQEPNRLKVLAAKFVTAIALAIGVSILIRVGILAGLGVSELLGRDVDWGGLGNQASLTGWLVLNVAMGTAFAALLQASAPAIVLFYLLPTLWSALAQIHAIQDIGRWLDSGQAWQHVIDGTMGGHWGQLVTATLLWVGVPLLAGAVRLSRRDVK